MPFFYFVINLIIYDRAIIKILCRAGIIKFIENAEKPYR